MHEHAESVGGKRTTFSLLINCIEIATSRKKIEPISQYFKTPIPNAETILKTLT